MLQTRRFFTQNQELTKTRFLAVRSGCAGRETEASLWPHPQDAMSRQREAAEPRERGETQTQPAATRPAFRAHQASEAKLSARKSPPGCRRSLHLQSPQSHGEDQREFGCSMGRPLFWLHAVTAKLAQSLLRQGTSVSGHH